MEVNIAQLEGSYQVLLSQYQSGAIDESAFIAEVDKLQFQDDYGRYWMIGAQSGSWHYYDGQSWHQADPREADKLPFMDENGRYWQRGAKSGDWYYYQPETNEWVKPTQNEPAVPEFGQSPPVHSRVQGQVNHASPSGQFQTELFQDDDGRYWSVGAKTGQWYFYDADGWHPAQEFETRTGKAQPPRTTAATYTSPSSGQQVTPASYHTYAASQQQAPYPQQPGPQSQPQSNVAPPQPAAPYTAQGYQQQPAAAEQSIKPEAPFGAPGPQHQTGESATAKVANNAPTPPPGSPGPSGTWFYFDGNQWLQYSTGEPPSKTPPDPTLIRDQGTESVKSKPAEPSVVAEFIDEDEPPVEVVDVEVITVVEAEPEPQSPVVPPAPQPVISEAPAQAPTVPIRVQSEVTSQPSARADKPRSTSTLSVDEVVPRREKSAPDLPADRGQSTSSDTDDVPARRASSDPGRPVSPKKRTQSAHEPTIIIPTGAATSPAGSRAMRPSSRPTVPIPPQQQRRARENTLPMEPVPPTSPSPPTTGPVTEHETGSIQQRQAPQPAPAISRQPDAKPAPQTKPQPSPKPAKEEIAGLPGQAQPAARKPKPDTEKSGYTLGDVLRAFPSTMWTGIAGVAVLVIFAVIIIIGFNYGRNLFGPSSVGAIQSPTPTLESGPPDTTPTPGPTPTGGAESSGPVATPTQAALVTYSSPDLDITLEYPENWEISEEDSEVVYAPSAAGLSTSTFEDANMRIGISSDNTSIADLLTEMLTLFPTDAESLNKGTISIGSQTWTSTQIRFDDEDLGQGIATIAVTSRDNLGYYLIALAPATEWNTVQPVFQAMINSFRFGTEAIPEPTSRATSTVTTRPTGTVTSDTGDEATTTPTRRATATPKPTETPEAVATPLVYAVKSGDTLLRIANEFGVDVDLLAEENGLGGEEILQIGQELVIPFTAEELAEYNASKSGASASIASRENQTPEAETSAAQPTAARTSAPAATAVPSQPEEPAGNAAPVSGRIVYPAFNPGTGVYDIWMVDLATGEQTPIAGAASQPAFNRDGSLLAYRSWDRGTRGIFFRDFIGGRGDIVTRFVEDALPTWSPDGLNFAFSSRKEGDRVPRVYIGNQQGEDPFAVGFQGEYPSTMPDGRLVVRGCTPAGDCGIFMLGPRGGGEKKISDDPSDTAPAPSPDGGKIAFMSFNRSGNNWEIWTMNADGTNLQQLTENNNADGLPAWSPDGQSIAFVSDRGGAWAVWVMNTDGSNQRKLFDMKGPPDGKILYDEFNSRGWLEERISWAP